MPITTMPMPGIDLASKLALLKSMRRFTPMPLPDLVNTVGYPIPIPIRQNTAGGNIDLPIKPDTSGIVNRLATLQHTGGSPISTPTRTNTAGGNVEIPDTNMLASTGEGKVDKWSYGAEISAAIPGEPIAFYDVKGENFDTAKAQIVYDEIDNEPLGYKIVLQNGQELANPKSDKIGGTPYFETLEEAQKFTESKLSQPTGGSIEDKLSRLK